MLQVELLVYESPCVNLTWLTPKTSYDLLGNYNTKFDDYADSCAPFAKTAIPEEYTGKAHAYLP